MTDSTEREEHGEQCDRCCGNGEIVTDWERYRHPLAGDVGDEAVTECPDCNGTGYVSPTEALAGKGGGDGSQG